MYLSAQRLDELYQAGSDDIAESKRAQGKENVHQLWDALMTLEALVSNDLEVRPKLTPVRPHSHNVGGSLLCHCSPV